MTMTTRPTIETDVIRNCRNCAHVNQSTYGAGYDTCSRAGGEYCKYVRQYKSWNHACDASMSGWQPRPAPRSMRQWLYNLLWK